MALNLDYPDGATPLDAEELEGLIPAHIATRGELNAWESRNVLKAEQWLRGARLGNMFSHAFVRRLHQRMFDETWKWAGTFRTTEKSIGIDPAHIAPRIVDLCEDIKVQLAHSTLPLDQMAAMFHHRLVSIHPFANGNGRHARLMADLLLTQNGAARFSWGEDASLTDSVAEGEIRRRYIAALRAADVRDYAPLFAFVRSGATAR